MKIGSEVKRGVCVCVYLYIDVCVCVCDGHPGIIMYVCVSLSRRMEMAIQQLG